MFLLMRNGVDIKMRREQKELIDPKELDEEFERKKDTRPGWKKLLDRMRRVDPTQSEKYKQRVGE